MPHPRLAGAVCALMAVIAAMSGCSPAGPEEAITDPPPSAAAPAKPLVPGRLPPGLTPDRDPGRTQPGFGMRATVYGAARGAPLDSPMVAAVAFYSTPHEGRPVDVGGRGAQVGRVGDLVWIAWETDFYERGGVAVYEGVVGRKLPQAQLTAAAEAFDGGDGAEIGGRGLRTRVSIGASGVPAGMRELYSGLLPVGGEFDDELLGGKALGWTGGNGKGGLTLRQVRRDARTEAAARLIAPESTAPVRGTIAAAGRRTRPRPPGLGSLVPGPRVLLWQEGGAILQVRYRDMPEETVAALLASLRPAGS